MSITSLYQKYMNKFLDGPEWYYTQALEKRPGNYRSVTAAIMIWTMAFYYRLFTIPAQGLVPLWFMLVFYSILAWNSPMRFVCIAFFVIFLLDFTLALIFRPKLEITRQVPRRI
ncbi:MAG: hypothetical protein PHV59_08280, partial [Victivallales bacterium]|nr:hypothetical protein [Victivallales bacterium]